MPSFLEAVRRGVDVIEFDVLTTQDGVVILHHDPLIEETGATLVRGGGGGYRRLLRDTQERIDVDVGCFLPLS